MHFNDSYALPASSSARQFVSVSLTQLLLSADRSTQASPLLGYVVGWLICTAIMAIGGFPASTADDDVATAIEGVTGAHTRVVWVQDQSRAQNDTLARGRNLLLMGFDSRDGQGERPIFRNARNYVKPLLTPTGERIVYSDHSQNRIFVVDWDGRNRRSLNAGFALDVWQDPVDGVEWVYAALRAGTVEEFVYRDVFRFQLDNPRVREPVWNATLISPDNFQLSANGLKVAGVFPWPNSGIADLARGAWERRSEGCWASMAPDNSYVCSIFDGPHRNLQLHAGDGRRIWKVNVAPIDMFEGFEVFHPRWSNHVRFLALTGPYKIKGPINEISGGGPEVEVYLGKFSEDFERIESWVRVTNNERADFYPDVWIDGGQQSTIPASVSGREQTIAEVPREKIAADPRLVFRWDRANVSNEVVDAGNTTRVCRIEPRGWGRFDARLALRCGAGFFEPDQISAAAIQQVLMDSTDSTAVPAFSLEWLLTPIDHQSEGDLNREAQCLFELGNPDGARVAVYQKQDSQHRNWLELVIKSDTTHVASIGRLNPGQPLHLVITVDDGRLKCWRDGRPMVNRDWLRLAWPELDQARIAWGADLHGNQPWQGSLEQIRIYRNALTSAEVATSFQRAQADRQRVQPAPDRSRVRARLVQATPLPSPASILPYRRALLVHHFRLQDVLEGEFTEQEFLVARWGILDGQEVPAAVMEPGSTVELSLETFDQQPQLGSERQLIEVDRFDLPMFYDSAFPF